MNEGIEVAAQLAALGLDPRRFLNTKDDFERNMMIELGRRIVKHKQIMDKNLAIEIANAVGKMFKA